MSEEWNTAEFFENASAEDVSRHLKAGADPNVRDEKGLTPLHLAAVHSKSPAVIRALSQAEADSKARDEDGATPLHLAAALSKTPEVVAALLYAHDANAGAKDIKGRTAWDYAQKNASLKGTEAFRRLEEETVAIFYESWNKPHFFQVADAEDVSRYLGAGADVSARDCFGRNPLHYAAMWNNNPAVITVLALAGADPNAPDRPRTTHPISRNWVEREERDEDGDTPLHIAARSTKNPEVITALVEAGADPNARAEGGVTPLHWAAVRSEIPGVITALAQAGAELNAWTESGETPLHVAARANETPAIITALVKGGADLDVRDGSECTPLHRAAMKSKTPEVVEVLLDAGADARATDDDDNTPWELAQKNAAMKGTYACQRLRVEPMAPHEDWNTPEFFRGAGEGDVSRCLKAGADPNARDETGLTPLHFAAAASKNPEIVTVLVAAGSDPNARDESELTPLHLAAFSKTPEVVAALLDAGADLGAKDTKGDTPWDYAQQNAALKGTEAYRRLSEEARSRGFGFSLYYYPNS